MTAAGESLANWESAVIARAKALGIDDAALTTLEPISRPHQVRAWLDQGFAAGMEAWFRKSLPERLDPRSRFPWARSVLVAALSYRPRDEQPHAATFKQSLSRGGVSQNAPSRDAEPLQTGTGHLRDQKPHEVGRVAAYARGRDYHRVLGDKLRRLCDELPTLLPDESVQARWYVDTGPVIERALAERSGMGFIGKNTCFIHHRLGSMVVLGVVLLSAPVKTPGATALSQCATCAKCLKACPTSALTEAFRLDARRCLSYLTIEHRGPVDETLRAAFDPWLFGCDECQRVCPFNKDAPAATDPALATRPAWLSLTDLLGDDDEALRARFAGTPLLRAKPEGLRRNALYVLGARRLEDPALRLRTEELTQDESPAVADAARWALNTAFAAENPQASGRCC